MKVNGNQQNTSNGIKNCTPIRKGEDRHQEDQ